MFTHACLSNVIVSLIFPILPTTFPWNPPSSLTAHMARLVSAVDQVIRRNVLSETGQRDVAIGQVWRNAVMVRVNWAWFAFPATIWCFTVTFLAMTIWKSSSLQQKAGPFKNSLLPMLLQQSESKIDDRISNRSKRSMRKQAKTSTLTFTSRQDTI